MIDLEFLEKYPLATELIKNWFHQLMVESFKDPEIAEEFKQFVQEQGIELDRLAVLIDSNPRMLFDVFDENEIYIAITTPPDWCWEISPGHTENSVCRSRKEAEHAAIEKAFEILETKLTPVVEEIEVTGEEIVEE